MMATPIVENTMMIRIKILSPKVMPTYTTSIKTI